jgi:hypothetical protein
MTVIIQVFLDGLRLESGRVELATHQPAGPCLPQ